MKNYFNLTVISETSDFDMIEGTEELVYWVSNRPDIDSWEERGAKKFWDFDRAYDYALWLHKKFNTEDIVRAEC